MLDRLRSWFGSKGAVKYDDTFFSNQWFSGWDTLKDVLHALLASEPRWRTVLDYGCGPGIMIDLMNDHGYDYVGCDVSPEARALYLERYGRHPDRYATTLDAALTGRRFDLMLSFDVLEHLRDEEVSTLLKQMHGVPELLFNISRVRSIPGHINIKSDRAWIRFFERHGWQLDRPGTDRLRARYLELRPGGGDLWHRNLFLLRRQGA